MSRRALARRAGLSLVCLQMLEKAIYGPREETARRLAEATGTDLHDFCRIAGIRPPSEWISRRLLEGALRKAYVEEHRALEAIAAEFGVTRETIAAYLRRYGVPLRRRGGPRRYAEIDPKPFAQANSDAHAYWLGFLAADGCVFTASGRNIVRLRLKASDSAHLGRFTEATGTPVPVVTSRLGYAEVTYHDTGFVLALARWGIVANKTLTIGFPRHLPPHLYSAFIRGYFDGDGSVYWRYRGRWRGTTCKFVSDSMAMLAGLASILRESNIGTGKMQRGSGHALILPILTSRANLASFAEYLYSGATVWLPRKRAVFRELGYLT